MLDSVPIEEIPRRPPKVTRPEARDEKARARAFAVALKAAARGSRWHMIQGSMFRDSADWFVQIHAWPGWQRGAEIHWSIKPMALDPLFWEIVGLPDHRRLPLSFRAVGRWALHPVPSRCGIAPGETVPEALAQAVVAWADARLSQGGFASTVPTMIADAEAAMRPGHVTAMSVCLRIFDGDLDGASRLCETEAADGPLSSGGFGMLGDDGTMVTFIDQAKAWIARRRGTAPP